LLAVLALDLAKARQFATESVAKAEKTELSEEYRKLETVTQPQSR